MPDELVGSLGRPVVEEGGSSGAGSASGGDFCDVERTLDRLAHGLASSSEDSIDCGWLFSFELGGVGQADLLELVVVTAVVWSVEVG